MKTAYVFLADGFEEIEAVTPIDLLRRADIQVETVGVTGKTVTGAHGIPVVADITITDFSLGENAIAIILPGGGKGTQNLLQSSKMLTIVKDASELGITIAAICAAPLVLQKAGLLKGRSVTAFPGIQQELEGVSFTGSPVEVDQNIITGRSAGTAIHFSEAILAQITTQKHSAEIVKGIFPPWE